MTRRPRQVGAPTSPAGDLPPLRLTRRGRTTTTVVLAALAFGFGTRGHALIDGAWTAIPH